MTKRRWFHRNTEASAAEDRVENVASVEAADAAVLEERIAVLQRYLASLGVPAQRGECCLAREKAIAEWLQKLVARGQASLREEAGRVIGEIGADVDTLTEFAADRVLDKLDEQTRRFSYDLAGQEARIRLTVTEGREDHAALLREQLRVLESIETDLTSEMDERLSRLAAITVAAPSHALDQVADKIGDRSAEAVTTGIKDLLAVIDRRFAWLEETVHDRLSALERSMSEGTTVIPDSEQVISVDRA